MKNFVIILSFLILLSTSFLSHAQDLRKIDSLKSLYSNCNNDTTKIDALVQLALQYNHINRDTADIYANKVINYSNQLNLIPQLSLGYKLLGFIAMGHHDMHVAIENYRKCIQLSQTLENDENNQASTFRHIGFSFEELGIYDSSFHYYSKSLQLYQQLNILEQIAESYRNLGGLKWLQGDFASASDYLEMSLPLYDSMNYQVGKAYAINNIAILYFEMEQYDMALDYYKEAYKIFDENNDDGGKAMILLNSGEPYWKMKEYDKALEYYFKSLEISKRVKNETNTAYCYTNIGIVNYEMIEYDKASKYYNDAMLIWNKIDNKTGQTYCLNYIGLLNLSRGEYQEAIKNVSECLSISIEIGSLDEIRRSYETLATVYAKTGKYKLAYKNHVAFKNYNDSIFSKESSQKLNSLQTKYELEKQQHRIAMQESQLELQNAKLEQNATFQKLMIAMFAAILIVVALITYAYIQKRKHNKKILKQKEALQFANTQLEQQKEEIEAQRDEIEAQRDEIEAQRDMVVEQKSQIEKINTEITDSIEYAEHIQSAILPHSDIRNELLGQHFIFFKPRDIVSGDFYWLTKVENQTIIAAADCTGHGVPGAFMSMLGVSYLNEIVNNEYITHPGVILRRLRKKIIKALQQKGEAGEQRDGMDISLCSIDFDKMTLQFSGANNPLYIVRDSTKETIDPARTIETESHILYEIKGDKMPIALYDRMDKFQTFEIKLLKGDCIYLFTDGFADQFGGPLGKKFKYKPFKELLLHNYEKNMESQHKALVKVFDEWRMDCEQVDDILVVGIRV